MVKGLGLGLRRRNRRIPAAHPGREGQGGVKGFSRGYIGVIGIM